MLTKTTTKLTYRLSFMLQKYKNISKKATLTKDFSSKLLYFT